jgi:predicted MFS family arabinose efflux permease
MNSSKPLTKSIIMDVVPKTQRARWNAAESINGATWAGSAMLGGYLIDRYGIVPNFLTTAVLQMSSLIPLVLIARSVPSENSK